MIFSRLALAYMSAASFKNDAARTIPMGSDNL